MFKEIRFPHDDVKVEIKDIILVYDVIELEQKNQEIQKLIREKKTRLKVTDFTAGKGSRGRSQTFMHCHAAFGSFLHQNKLGSYISQQHQKVKNFFWV